MPERMLEVGEVEICAETFGDPAACPVLLVQGIGASMLWWDEEFCEGLANADCFVIRYDHRDTGRSTSYEPRHPGYTSADLQADLAGVLDALDLSSAHVVGVSAGGVFAQVLALEQPDRVRSLVLISTSPAVPTGRELPPPTDAFGRFLASVSVDWSDRDSVIDYVAGYAQMLAGDPPRGDEARIRALIRREVARARDFAARHNHDLLSHDGAPSEPLASMAAPTLVVHGTADPLFPIEHGQTLAEAIPGARLLTLDGAGHGLAPADAALVADAIIEHLSGIRAIT